jgi:antitoxin (DNA-binding transcriptional repressor) of toxin-antitoxin stability system
MATVINQDDAFAHLSEVVMRAMSGEEIDIEQGGQVRLKLIPVRADPQRRRTFGAFRGKVSVPQSAFDPLPEEELRAWEGR